MCLIALRALPAACQNPGAVRGTGDDATRSDGTHCSSNATRHSRAPLLRPPGAAHTSALQMEFFWLLFAFEPSFLHNHLPSCFHDPCSGSLTPPPVLSRHFPPVPQTWSFPHPGKHSVCPSPALPALPPPFPAQHSCQAHIDFSSLPLNNPPLVEPYTRFNLVLVPAL